MESVKTGSTPANGHLVNGLSEHRNHDRETDRNTYGKRLITTVAEELARTNPDKVHASIAISADLSQGFRDVTISQMVNGADHMAWKVDQLFGPSDSFETISYLGISDLRYSIMVLASIKTGYKTMVPSVRNSLSMNLSLLKRTNCDKIFYSQELAQKVQELREERPSIVAIPMPSLEELLESRPHHYPYDKIFDEVENDPIIIVHTSGSTGDPKPITITHGAASCWDGARHIPKTEGRKNMDYALWNFEDGGRFYSSFPPFHLAGMVNNTFLPIWYNTTIVLGPPERPGTGELVCQAMRQFKLRAVYCAPSILEQICQESDGLEMAKDLDFVIFTGGPLAPAAGDALSKVTDLCQIYGSSEIGVTPALIPFPENWAYLEFNPFYGHVLEEVGDGQYEMVLYRDMKLKRFRQICHTFPDVEVWRTKDVFRQHPSNSSLWTFHGRTDDIMVLGNGEKFNPVPMEKVIEGHPLVHGALMIGQGRDQPALIVEPQSGIKEQGKELIESIWQIVQEANSKGPGHAKIVRSMIIIADPAKPFPRAGKGTAVRGKTVEAFADEIEKLFTEENDDEVQDVPDLYEPYDLNAIRLFVQTAMKSYFPKTKVAEQDDFFVLGVDSLQTVELAARLRVGLKKHPRGSRADWLTMRTIYAKPTVSALSAEIDDRLNHDGKGENMGEEAEQSRVARMSNIVDVYSQAILEKGPPVKDRRRRRDRLTVVLTGSTGSLGMHLLEALLNDPKVSKIYCLNRSQDAQERHEKNFASRGLDHTHDLGSNPLFFDASNVIGSNTGTSSKVKFLKVDFGAADFGLQTAIFNELTSSVDAIIHNAWKVDFLHNLDSFEPVHIRGVRTFIEWSARSERRPHIFFVSSISSVGGWGTTYPGRKPVSETPHESYHVAQALGYGESKHVSERIFTFATERRGLPSSILRVGQIAGPVDTNGSWHETEWFPSLVKTSKSLNLIPDSIPDINWIPVDRLATIILEIVHRDTEHDVSQVYNMVNPHFASWSNLVGPVQKHFGSKARVVPYREWLDALKKVNINDPKQTADKPALKILDFYEALGNSDVSNPLTYDTRHGQEASRTMARLPAVKPAWMSTWLKQWDF